MGKKRGHTSNMARCMMFARRQVIMTELEVMTNIAHKKGFFGRLKIAIKYVLFCEIEGLLEE